MQNIVAKDRKQRAYSNSSMLEHFFPGLHSVTHVGSLKLDLTRVFTAWKSANASTQDLFLSENWLLNFTSTPLL